MPKRKTTNKSKSKKAKRRTGGGPSFKDILKIAGPALAGAAALAGLLN